MKKNLILLIISVISALSVYGQAKKPTIMVFPAETWCVANGYAETIDNQGDEVIVPNYEKAIKTDMDLDNVITKIGELMAERGLPLKSLSSTIRTLRQNSAEDEMTTSRSSGASISETPLDKLLKRAKADIMVEVGWKVNAIGPKQSITYTLKGIDTYSNKQVAAAGGTGPASFSVDLPILLEEAVLEQMDNFVAQLQSHFDDMAANGREIVVNVKIFDNGSDLSFDNEYGGQELVQVIDDWMSDNTVNHRYNMSDATDDYLSFEQVRIPLYRENGNAMDTRYFATQLKNFLSKSPYNITAKILTKGLGRADIILGEK